MLDGGRITERGTHEELLELNGLYAKLVSRQLHRKANLIEQAAVDAAGEENDQSAEQRQSAADEREAQMNAADDVDALYEDQPSAMEMAPTIGTYTDLSALPMHLGSTHSLHSTVLSQLSPSPIAAEEDEDESSGGDAAAADASAAATTAATRASAVSS